MSVNILKIIWATVHFLTVIVWYVMCWLSLRNEKFQLPALILICVLGVMAVFLIVFQ